MLGVTRTNDLNIVKKPISFNKTKMKLEIICVASTNDPNIH